MMPPPPISRRAALPLLSGLCNLGRVRAADSDAPLRIAISETLVVGVNLNDARAAMQIWVQRMQADFHLKVEIDPKIFLTSEEVTRGIRGGQLDSAALSVVEYRPIADLFDTQQLLVGAGGSGPDNYVLLVKKGGPFTRLDNLRGCRLSMLKTPKMCVASAWVSTLLDEEQLGPADGFFGSTVSDTKVSRVILPVFFEQADVCLASKRGFDTMCELNPQVAKTLVAIGTSPVLVTCFYAFRKGFPAASRSRFLDVHKVLLSNPSGRQLATLFQFDEMNISDAGCLSGSLAILDRAEKIRTRTAGGRKR